MTRYVLVLLLCLVGTVSASPYCDGALMAQRQAPSMPEPGNPGHREPKKGAYCDRSAAVEHHCECHSKCVEQEDGTLAPEEDGPHCRAYCFRNYCRCPWEGCK